MSAVCVSPGGAGPGSLAGGGLSSSALDANLLAYSRYHLPTSCCHPPTMLRLATASRAALQIVVVVVVVMLLVVVVTHRPSCMHVCVSDWLAGWLAGRCCCVRVPLAPSVRHSEVSRLTRGLRAALTGQGARLVVVQPAATDHHHNHGSHQQQPQQYQQQQQQQQSRAGQGRSPAT